MPVPFRQSRGLYAITDCDKLNEIDLLQKTEQILKAGICALQYRDKKNNVGRKVKMAQQLLDLCQQTNTPLIINDDIELAKTIDADGVHVGKQDSSLRAARDYLGGKIIGVSCYNNLPLAVEAEIAGADYIAFGSFFPSITKPAAVIAELELLTAAKKALHIPIVAIGGITVENGTSLVQAGANYLAVISGLYYSDDARSSVQAYSNLFCRDK